MSTDTLSALENCFEHPINGSTVLPYLEKALPHSIALHRRVKHKQRLPDSHIFATFAPDTREESIPSCWAICYADRSVRPETECWLYLAAQSSPDHDPSCSHCRAALLAIMRRIADLRVPESIHAKAFTQAGLTTRYASHYSNPNVLLIGALGQRPAELITAMGFSADGFPAPGVANIKWLFTRETLAAKGLAAEDGWTLPDGLRWGRLEDSDLALTRARTEIPRQDATLRALESIAIFPSSAGDMRPSPIAWAFIGFDGSLTNLHVENQYRGQGLAKKISAKLMMQHIDEEGAAHVDSIVSNEGGVALFKSIGGKVVDTVYWMRVDLQKVRACEWR